MGRDRRPIGVGWTGGRSARGRRPVRSHPRHPLSGAGGRPVAGNAHGDPPHQPRHLVRGEEESADRQEPVGAVDQERGRSRERATARPPQRIVEKRVRPAATNGTASSAHDDPPVSRGEPPMQFLPAPEGGVGDAVGADDEPQVVAPRESPAAARSVASVRPARGSRAQRRRPGRTPILAASAPGRRSTPRSSPGPGGPRRGTAPRPPHGRPWVADGAAGRGTRRPRGTGRRGTGR